MQDPRVVSNRRHYFWAFIERVAPLAISFVVSILIARKVGPAAYGLVAMLGIFMALGQAFTELGFGSALVQKQDSSADDETSVFVINLVAGVLITMVLCAMSPLVADFFRQPILIPLLCAQAFGLVIASTALVQFALISRRMQFRFGAMIEVAATISSGVVGLTMAYKGFGVWSLVGLGLSREATRAAGAWIASDWRPRGRFSMPHVRAMWSYCGKLLLASLLHRIVTNLNSVFIGRMFPPAALGLYSRAAGLQTLPIGVITGMVQRVAFPLFSRGQSDKELLRDTLRRQSRLIALVVAMIMALLAVLAPDLVPWLLGPEWQGSVSLLQILCLAGVLASVFPLHSQMTMALGESDLFFRIELAKKVAIILVLAIVSRYGIAAFAWGAVAISVADYALSAYPSTRLVAYSWAMQVFDVLPACVIAAGSAAIVLLIPWQETWPALPLMTAKSIAFVASASLGLYLLRKSFFGDVWQLLVPGAAKIGAR